MKCYLSGPIRGMKDRNREAFEFYATKLREQGFLVFNPLEKESQEGGTR